MAVDNNTAFSNQKINPTESLKHDVKLFVACNNLVLVASYSKCHKSWGVHLSASNCLLIPFIFLNQVALWVCTIIRKMQIEANPVKLSLLSLLMTTHGCFLVWSNRLKTSQYFSYHRELQVRLVLMLVLFWKWLKKKK